MLRDASIANVICLRRCKHFFDRSIDTDHRNHTPSPYLELTLPQPVPMVSKSSELSKVVGSVAGSLRFLAVHDVICFRSLVESTHPALHPSTDPRGDQHVVVDHHVEECGFVFSVVCRFASAGDVAVFLG